MYHKITLDNGLRLITAPMPHTRSICLAFFIGTGSRYEPDAEAGISHFIEHLCFKGTERRPTSKEISEAIEGTGGILNGGTNKELTTFWCKVASPHFPLALDVLTDLLRHSKFEPSDIERERQIIIEEIDSSLDLPHHRVNMLIDKLLWPDQPLGRDVAGSKETITTLTRQQFLDYFTSHYLPNNTVVSVAGNIQQEEVIEMVREAFADWSKSELPNPLPADDHQDTPHFHIESKDTEQVHLCFGLRGLSFFHPDRFCLDLLNVILGEGMSSRLFINIRDRRGLAYDIHSYVSHFRDSGSLIVYAGVQPKQVKSALTAILEELSQLKSGIPEAELTKAKELSKGRLLLRMEDSRSVVGWSGVQEILLGQVLSVDEVLSIIDAITTDNLKRIARELFITEKLNLAIVGPISKEEPLAELLKL